MISYAVLFLSAFLSATLLPAQSEAVLLAMLYEQEHSPWILVAIATAGNSLGSAVNWLMGMAAHRFAGKKLFPVKREKLQKAEAWYHKYGRWSLLLSWAPFIGDPITLAAGLLKEPFWSFFSITCLAKFLRYLVLAGICLAAL